MVQRLRVLAAFAETYMLFLSISSDVQSSTTPALSHPCPLLTSVGTCTHVAYTYPKTHIFKMLKMFSHLDFFQHL